MTGRPRKSYVDSNRSGASIRFDSSFSAMRTLGGVRERRYARKTSYAKSFRTGYRGFLCVGTRPASAAECFPHCDYTRDGDRARRSLHALCTRLRRRCNDGSAIAKALSIGRNFPQCAHALSLFITSAQSATSRHRAMHVVYVLESMETSLRELDAVIRPRTTPTQRQTIPTTIAIRHSRNNCIGLPRWAPHDSTSGGPRCGRTHAWRFSQVKCRCSKEKGPTEAGPVRGGSLPRKMGRTALVLRSGPGVRPRSL